MKVLIKDNIYELTLNTINNYVILEFINDCVTYTINVPFDDCFDFTANDLEEIVNHYDKNGFPEGTTEIAYKL